MIFPATFWWVLRRTFILCVPLGIITASCNISRINHVFKSSTPYGRLTPRVCGLESSRIPKNETLLAFVANTPSFNKYKVIENKYVDFDEEESRVGVAPLYVKRPTTESQVTQVVKSNRSPSLFSGDFFSSRLRSLKDAVSNVSKDEVLKVANKVGVFGLWYLGSVFYNFENKKTVNMYPLPKTVAAVQMLTAVPFLTLKWLFNPGKAPKFYLPECSVEKVDLKRDGFLGSVKKRLKNGLMRAKSLVNPYALVVVQGAHMALLRFFSLLPGLDGMDQGYGVMKALQPLLVSLFSFMFEEVHLPTMAYLSLLPLVTGLIYATTATFEMSSVSFSGLLEGLKSTPFMTTLLSSGVSSMKSANMKKFLNRNLEKVGKNLTPENVNKVVNLLGTLFFVPLALEDKDVWKYWYNTLGKRYKGGTELFLRHLVLSSLAYTLVNEVSYMALSDLSPVSQGVANAMKNLFTMAVNSFVFDRHLTKQELYGSALAIAGTLLYYLAQN